MEATKEINSVLQYHHFSFSKSSCPGAGLQRNHENYFFESKEQSATKSYMVGGYTCHTPSCFNNSKRNKHLSFYNFPNGKSKEKQMLWKKWIHVVCLKDFKPIIGHRFCSGHFAGGKKIYLNNIPVITHLMQKAIISRATSKARN